MFGVFVHRRMVGTQRVDGAVGESGTQRVAVALAAQRRRQIAVWIEITDVHLRQMRVMNADVTGHGQAAGAGVTHHRHAFSRGQPRNMDARAGFASHDQDGRQRNRFRGDRNRWQAETCRDFAVVGDAVFGQRRILRAQPDRKIESRGVLQCVHQHLGVGERRFGLRERDAAGIVQFRHFGQVCTLQRDSQRSHRVHMRLVEILGAELEHFHQTRLVERWVGVRRAGQAGDAAGNGRLHFGFECRQIFKARFAQAYGEIDQSGTDDTTGRIDDAVGGESRRRIADGNDLACGDKDIAFGIHAVLRVDQAAVLDMDFHRDQFPARMLMTAMRMAMPKVTWGRITDCRPSATLESISTPRFIGPGCSTMASGLASASLSSVRP